MDAFCHRLYSTAILNSSFSILKIIILAFSLEKATRVCPFLKFFMKTDLRVTISDFAQTMQNWEGKSAFN